MIYYSNPVISINHYRGTTTQINIGPQNLEVCNGTVVYSSVSFFGYAFSPYHINFFCELGKFSRTQDHFLWGHWYVPLMGLEEGLCGFWGNLGVDCFRGSVQQMDCVDSMLSLSSLLGSRLRPSTSLLEVYWLIRPPDGFLVDLGVLYLSFPRGIGLGLGRGVGVEGVGDVGDVLPSLQLTWLDDFLKTSNDLTEESLMLLMTPRLIMFGVLFQWPRDKDC